MAMHLKRKCEQGTLAAAAFVLTASISGDVLAAEGGGSSYLQGTYGDFAAAVHPGTGYLRNDVILYDAGIGGRPISGGYDPGFDQKLWMDRLTFGGFAEESLFGGRFGLEVQLPYVFDLTVEQNGPGPFRSPRDHDMGDPVFKPQIAWGAGPHYGTLALGIVAPLGTHDTDRVVSIGRHYWSFDPSFTYTYLNDSGWDLSGTLGYMINLENNIPGPNYETGDELHLDVLFGKHFGDRFALGVAAYWYSQLTDDEGPIPAGLEPGYKSESFGFGPAFKFGSKNFSVVGKWLYDTDADNRLKGDLYMLSFVAHFGGESPPPPMPVAPPVARAEPPPPPPPPPPADADGDGVVDLSDLCPATPRGDRVDVRGCSCDVTVKVNFRSNSTEISGADAILLDALADQVRQLPTLEGEIGGHTDSQGSEAFNEDLSRRRALAARDYLASRGLNVSQLAVKGYGESEPVADNTTPEGRQQNRRVVLRRTNCQVAQ